MASTRPQNIQPCFMIKRYDIDFPPLQRQERDGTSSRPYVQQYAVESSRQLKSLSLGEEVLNWQIRKAKSQNKS